MHKVNDLVEGNEGDKAVVTAAAPGLVIVRWDCTDRESDWLPAQMFTNLSERVRELDA